MSTIPTPPATAAVEAPRMPQSPDLLAERLARLKSDFPDLFTDEGRLNPAELQRLVGEGESERYEFRWHGKGEAKRRAFMPTTAALNYDASRSMNPDQARGNLIIEGENLEVLKLLLSSYRGQVKCIYIDPPYNTGKDFVYSDNYTQDKRPYWEQTGVTEGGVKVDTNAQADGRYHSNWLNMIYPRLLVARQLLREDGVVMVSIDDYEIDNLRRTMDEAFGEENHVATLVWEKGRKNDAKLFSVGHEYMAVYAKDLQALKDAKTIWREAKPGAKEIWDEYVRLRKTHGESDLAIEADLTEWFRNLPAGHASKRLARYRRVDSNGPWRDRDISWPGGGGPRYDVLHKDTGLPCKVPERGWGISAPDEMQRQIDLDLIVFRADHTEPPFRKAHLRPVADELDPENGLDEEDENATADPDDAGLAMQVRGSCIYKQSQVAVKALRKLMGAKVFPNPKDYEELAKLIQYVTGGDPCALVLDFFGGSGSTAHAVLKLNREDGGNRQFVTVQLPEEIKPKEAAYKQGYRKISDITIDRVKRVIAGTGDKPQPLDAGFKVFSLVKSNFPRVEFAPDPDKTEAENLIALKAYIQAKEASLFNVLPRELIQDEVFLKCGFQLDYQLERVTELTGNEVWRVSDSQATPRTAVVCFDTQLTAVTLDWFKAQTGRVILLEAALDTTMKWNLRHTLGARFIAF
ncbi:site-specific DNA-methyltransferase [Rhodoferax sp.]|uniref:site-specific DNA-methyltransferase n=1 Tax=Rhodoferax sp. TaxID=50421 RepID=UPI0025E2B51C|nr:site-specific DNA-methyltransferase [Rhodoferax sp.]